jgi:uncharacterized tellurite resistance protein B-like protein
MGFLVWFTQRFRRGKAGSLCSDRSFALGVLLRMVGAVAQADSKFLPEEEDKIRQVLTSHLKVSEKDLEVILAAIRQVAMQRIDFDNFVREANKNLPKEVKACIISDLFRVAWADGELAESELAVIRRIAGMLEVPDEVFVEIETRILDER